MSGLAQVLHARGYAVQGSDAADSALMETLRKSGIPSLSGHDEAYLKGVQRLVVSSAICENNPEVRWANANHIPVIHRAQMLAALMQDRPSVAISGTHGKTTTTSLVSTLLELAGFDPTTINGGIMNQHASNVRLGASPWMVVEADESDGSLLKLPATIGVVTNIDPDHMEFFKTTQALQETFSHFIPAIPSHGCAIVCTDSPLALEIVENLKGTVPLLTYGMAPHAQIRAEHIGFTPDGMTFDAVFSDGTRLEGLLISLYGEHNVLNALVCVAIAHHLKISSETLRQALATFTGVKRRFTRTGVTHGVTFIDDYAHHPVEIRAVLKAARRICTGRVIAVCQPHRYSRLSTLFEDFTTCFKDADDLVLVPIYAAGERPLNISSLDLSQAVNGVSGTVQCLSGLDDVAPYLKARVRPNDMVICMGAGNITHLAHALPGHLEETVGVSACENGLLEAFS